jgi:hypothetical protein
MSEANKKQSNMSDRNRIYLCLAHMSEAGLEQKYIQEAFDTNWVVPLGPNVNGFEKDLEDFVNQVDSSKIQDPRSKSPATCNLEPGTLNLEPAACRLMWAALNLEF